ncbi:adenylate/guanylate cyclase domain-containing protein [Microseira wollei]|uniref:Two-component response regulator n=1 Tax=Microseira wollei NIES-4236 TaxID=2530354 RepID=A0AAV3XD32_9CYAN|nr:adenylate/guanylate cyclase domain-containing protein [Microseira wollei]GET39785.1 two-component response regulator [Microseira wollei NIES-4236]
MTQQVIICVDDETTVLKSIKTELKEAFGNNYLIEIAEGGNDALELVQELLEDGYEIPLIISDYVMPDMKGDELLRQVHQLSPKTLKIMLTGQATIEGVANAIKYAKLYRYITKPWEAEDLKLTVTEAVYSYLQDKKLAEQNAKLQQMNQALETLNREQAALIAKLHESESRLRQFLEAVPVGVEVIDVQGQLYFTNQRSQELRGKTAVTSELNPFYIAGTNQPYPWEKLPISRALQGETSTVDDVEIHLGNKIIPIEIWGTPIYDRNGKISYAIVAFQDITERQKAEADRQKFIEELFELNANLEIALQKESELTRAASRFVPNQFLSLLGHQSIVDVKLGEAVQQEMTVLFSDIRSFTTISEGMTPQDNFKFINAFLSRMEPAIVENNGFIDKYIGDAIMALFGGSADDAVKAGLAMLKMLNEYNTTRGTPARPTLQVGIGIHTGSLMLGTVGGYSRMDGTVISDAVNLAARIENLTKEYGVSLLISQQTLSRLQNPMEHNIRFIERVTVKGKSKAVAVFEVFDGDDPQIKQGKLATKSMFEQALFLAYRHCFSEAALLFQDCLRINPSDTIAQIYLQRCQR